jgi:hypothetical protein
MWRGESFDMAEKFADWIFIPPVLNNGLSGLWKL